MANGSLTLRYETAHGPELTHRKSLYRSGNVLVSSPGNHQRQRLTTIADGCFS